MSEEIPSSRPRPVRVLALHAGPSPSSPSSSSSSSSWTPSQSAASYRAQLAPLINTLPSHWEVHFIEAGFAVEPTLPPSSARTVAQPGIGHTRGERIREALLDCSLLDAWSAQVECESIRRAMVEDHASGSFSSASSLEASSHLEYIRSSLVSSEDEARTSTYNVYLRSGIDEAEALLMAEGQLAPDRDWFIELSGDEDSGATGSRPQREARLIGLQASLARVGDYLREKGPFHIGIGSGSGYEVLRLASSLLAASSSSSLPLSTSIAGSSATSSSTSSSVTTSSSVNAVLAYPLLFPLLPLNAPAPRMGGWEVMPSVPLPNGRRRAVCQGGLHALIRLGSLQPVLGRKFWRARGMSWEKRPGEDTNVAHSTTLNRTEVWKIALVPLPSSAAKRDQDQRMIEGEEEEQDEDEDVVVAPVPPPPSSSSSSSPGSANATQASLQANSSTLLTPGMASYLSRLLRNLCGHLEIVPGLEPQETRRLMKIKEQEERERDELAAASVAGAGEGRGDDQEGVQILRDRIAMKFGKIDGSPQSFSHTTTSAQKEIHSSLPTDDFALATSAGSPTIQAREARRIRGKL